VSGLNEDSWAVVHHSNGPPPPKSTVHLLDEKSARFALCPSLLAKSRFSDFDLCEVSRVLSRKTNVAFRVCTAKLHKGRHCTKPITR